MTNAEFPFLPDHNDLIRNRYEKADAMRAEGLNPYCARFIPSHTSAQVLERGAELEASGESVSIMGRAMTIRSFGKSAFFHVRDRDGQLQVYVQQNTLNAADYDVFKKYLDGGDLVGAEGTLFTTKTGERTLKATSLKIVSKSVRQLPEKWSGLKDVELRYRQRYVDLIANPEVADIFRNRSRIVSSMRRFLDGQGFMEVETPMLQTIYGGASARPFVTHMNALDLPLYMRIAPELFLKRLVVGGLDRVYEINRNFRNEGLSPQHNPEFTMMELYAGGWNAERQMEFVEQIYAETARGAFGKTTVTLANGTEFDLAKGFHRVKIVDAVAAQLGAAVDWSMPLAELRALAESKSHGIPSEANATDAAIIFLFEELCEAALQEPTFVYEFPKSVSPLAKSCEGRPEVADRFELYANGIELANGYSELNDPREQYLRFLEQTERRKGGDLEAMSQIDEDYVRALEYGMVPTSGLGIGIDRTVMLMTGASSIRDVILFPLMKPHGAGEGAAEPQA